MRRDFFRLVKERGLDLRFGAATVITSVFFMAPLTALFLAFFYNLLRQRGMDADQASGLAFVIPVRSVSPFRYICISGTGVRFIG